MGSHVAKNFIVFGAILFFVLEKKTELYSLRSEEKSKNICMHTVQQLKQ